MKNRHELVIIVGVNFAFGLIHFLGSGMRAAGELTAVQRRKVTHSNFLIANFSDRTSSDLLVPVHLSCQSFFYWLQNTFDLEGNDKRDTICKTAISVGLTFVRN